MHLLPCPHCQAPIEVAPSKAGGQVNCPSCQAVASVPKLGDLKQLPLAGPAADAKPVAAARTTSSGNQIGFVALGVIATASLLIGGFCTIRWFMIDAPMTTEIHVARFHTQYKELKPAELIREFEQMEEHGIDMPIPWPYKKTEQEKRGWGLAASIAGGVCGIAFLGAVVLSLSGRRHPAS